MHASNLQLVSNCFTTAVLLSDKLVILELIFLLDKNNTQTEYLLQPHQARAFGMVVNDVAKRYPVMDSKQDSQCVSIGADTQPFHFDGWKCSYHITGRAKVSSCI